MWKRNNNFDMENIDVTFDFTSDTPYYWDGFWNNELGYSKRDPDSKSPMLRKYHQILWSRELPCGEKMELTDGKSRYYLKWKDFYFGSDSILVSFRHSDRKAIGMRKRFFIITYLLWHIIRTNSVSLFRNCKFQFLESFFVYIGQDEKILQFLA